MLFEIHPLFRRPSKCNVSNTLAQIIETYLLAPLHKKYNYLLDKMNVIAHNLCDILPVQIQISTWDVSTFHPYIHGHHKSETHKSQSLQCQISKPKIIKQHTSLHHSILIFNFENQHCRIWIFMCFRSVLARDGVEGRWNHPKQISGFKQVRRHTDCVQ